MKSFSTISPKLLVIMAVAILWQGLSVVAQDSYQEERTALVAADTDMRFSSDISLDSSEQLLDSQMHALRRDMMMTYEREGFFPPKSNFLKYKSHIDTTRLFSLFRMMPKGGILHLHPSAAVDFHWLIDTLATMPNCYVYWDGGLNEKGTLQFFHPDTVEEGFQPLMESLVSRPSLKDSLYQLFTFDRTEIDLDSFDIWDEFNLVFARISGVYTYRPMYKSYLSNVMHNMRQDNIQHVEMRTILSGGFYDIKDGYSKIGLDSAVQMLDAFVKEYTAKYPRFTIKSIFTDLRFKDSTEIQDIFEQAYATRAKYPELIKGFDLVANEDDGNSTLYFLSSWNRRQILKEKYGIDMPMYLHDGESDWAHITNLYDAVVLDCKRIGHGFNLMFFPSLVKAIVDHNIALEVSPLSNQILDYVQDLRMHPANAMLRHGVQLTINSDDPAIFGYEGTSHDYWSIYLAWELTLADIKKLVFNAIEFSALNPDEKAVSLAHLNSAWQQFVVDGITQLSTYGY